jgi:hypothetical protein
MRTLAVCEFDLYLRMLGDYCLPIEMRLFAGGQSYVDICNLTVQSDLMVPHQTLYERQLLDSIGKSAADAGRPDVQTDLKELDAPERVKTATPKD